MTTVLETLRMRKRLRRSKSKNPALRLGLAFAALFSLLLVAGSLGLSLTYSNLTRDLPSIASLPPLLEPPTATLLQPTRLYDRSGEHVIASLQNPGVGERRFLRVPSPGSSGQTQVQEAFPPDLVEAIIAAQDPQFYQHSGATWQGVWNGAQPTLAQRLASDLLLWDEAASLRRSLRESLLAMQITDAYGREKVLAWYLNSAPFGVRVVGADAAARLYLGKPAVELNLIESAWLASAAGQPAVDPASDPEAARSRALEVLQSMYALGFITPEEVLSATQQSLSFRPLPSEDAGAAPAFVTLVLEELAAQITPSRLERGGLRILTTLDIDLQAQAVCAAATQMLRLNDPAAEAPAPDGATCQAARLLPTQTSSPENLPAGLEANLVALDPTTGEVLALVGARIAQQGSPGVGEASRLASAPLREHSAGSLLTPFIYLTAFSRGYVPASLVWDIPIQTGEMPVENFDGRFHGPVRLRLALANDYLVPAAQLLTQLGAQNVRQTLAQMGVIALNLGGQGRLTNMGDMQTLLESRFNLLELSQAYAVLANQGNLVGWTAGESGAPQAVNALRPITVLHVEDSAGNTWAPEAGAAIQPQERPVISPQLAYLLVHSLMDEAARWPSFGHPNPMEIGRPAAVKSGQTLSGRDVWTIGATPQILIGVWMGYTEADPPNLIAAKSAAGLWHSLMQYAHRDLPVQGWKQPAGISAIEVCDPSGQLPSEACPAIVSEVFPEGSQPNHIDTLYQKLAINRETGRLATIFTPAEFIVERVFMKVPPEATQWAKSAGIALPPDSYDVMLAARNRSPQARITSPQMFAYVNGKVNITGTAATPGFDSYHLQVGRGLNPKTWLQIGREGNRAVTDRLLASWDTTGLSGLYVIQLLVMNKDQSIATDTIQVTVDNQPPEIEALSPPDGERYEAAAWSEITFHLQASDDLGIASVAFTLDGSPLIQLAQPPFAYPWQVQPGEHVLTVTVTDLAGNTSEASTRFSVQR